MVRVAEIAGIQDINIALVDDLHRRSDYFVGWVGEEVEPILGLVECLREEDKVRTVVCGGLDMDASELHVFGVDALGFLLRVGVLPRMWWITENL